MPEKTPAQKKAQQKYMERFAVARVRMDKDRYERVQAHAAQRDGGSVNAFINRAIDETMERDAKRERTPQAGSSGQESDDSTQRKESDDSSIFAECMRNLERRKAEDFAMLNADTKCGVVKVVKRTSQDESDFMRAVELTRERDAEMHRKWMEQLERALAEKQNAAENERFLKFSDALLELDNTAERGE